MIDDLDLKPENAICNGFWSEDDKNQEWQTLAASVMVDKVINLRIGTVVMCVINLNTNIYNGSKGVVIDFKDNNPVIKFNDITLLISPHVWQSEKIPMLGIKQLPLIYAWAITIHKSQGMTLDTAYIDIGNFIFECGQTYVALSRVKTLEGLYLKNLDISRVTVNMKVKNFYNSLESQESQENQS
jgi:ATP-dependent DNA helicase PIF1